MAARGRRTLALMFLIFGAPVALAWVYALYPALLPKTRSNYGQLIVPPVATPLKGSWTLVVPRGETCDSGCQRAHTIASVVRRALGVDAAHRVREPLDCADSEAKAACTALMQTAGAGTTLVIIDPMGNAMMRYGPELTPKGLLKDMQRLLSVSKDWRTDGI